MDSGPSDDASDAGGPTIRPYDDMGPVRTDDIDMRAVAAARAVPRKPLEADEQVVYDKIKSGALKGTQLNAMTGEMEPLDWP